MWKKRIAIVLLISLLAFYTAFKVKQTTPFKEIVRPGISKTEVSDFRQKLIEEGIYPYKNSFHLELFIHLFVRPINAERVQVEYFRRDVDTTIRVEVTRFYPSWSRTPYYQ